MVIVKHFPVKMRLVSFCCANLIKYKYTFCLEFVILVKQQWPRKSLQREWRFMLLVSIKCFAGKGFCDFVCLCEL